MHNRGNIEPGFESLVRNLPGMVYRCHSNQDRTVTLASPGCIAITGFSPEELVQKQMRIGVDLIHPQDRLTVWNALQSTLEKGLTYDLTYRMVRTDGEEVWVRDVGSKTIHSRNGISYLEGYITNITQQRQH
jgi:PAS domain S-box-containing protein